MNFFASIIFFLLFRNDENLHKIFIEPLLNFANRSSEDDEAGRKKSRGCWRQSPLQKRLGHE
jgi:hypothetical protein